MTQNKKKKTRKKKSKFKIKEDKVYVSVPELKKYGLPMGLEGLVVKYDDLNDLYLVDFGSTIQTVKYEHIKNIKEKKKEKRLDIVDQPSPEFFSAIDESFLDHIGVPEAEVEVEVEESEIDMEIINNPKHYTQGIECWDYIISHDMSFLQGSAIKYVTRYKNKNGKEDLLKAISFINKIIETEY